MSDNFQFIGFEPTNELKTYSKEVFWLMEDRAPSQSAMTAIVSKIENSYHTRVKIHCSSGIFTAEMVSIDPHAGIEDVYLKVKELMKTWVAHRGPNFENKEIA